MEIKEFNSIADVITRIDDNFRAAEEMIEYYRGIDNLDDRLELLELIGLLRANFVTGVYADSYLENEIIGMSNEIMPPMEVHDTKDILIVMTKSHVAGGHSVLVNNWIEWDNDNRYSIVFTDQEISEVTKYIKSSIRKSGGTVSSLAGSLREKAIKLRKMSENYRAIILFSHMYDVIPELAYGSDDWNIPIFFYNHADFRFTYGFKIADLVMNLNAFDQRKTVKYRGIDENSSVIIRFPNGGKICSEEFDGEYIFERDAKRKELSEQYGFDTKAKIIVSCGADNKFDDIVGLSFTDFVEDLLAQYHDEAYFFIIGANYNRDKWIRLNEKTNGRARALGVLERRKMDELISCADLYIVSFPMSAEGTMAAEEANVPYLAMLATDRGIEEYGPNGTKSVNELLNKSLEILNGNGLKYLGHMGDLVENQEKWKNRWNEYLKSIKKHKKRELTPNRSVETHEIVNCQLMQKQEAYNTRSYIAENTYKITTLLKLIDVDLKYHLGLFPEKCSLNCIEPNFYVKMYKKCDLLYFYTAKLFELSMDGIYMSDYFLLHNYNSVAIYGMSKLGFILLKEFKHKNICVPYVVDRNANEIEECGVKIFFPDDELPLADVIINTTAFSNSEILDGLSTKYPMISLFELIDELA